MGAEPFTDKQDEAQEQDPAIQHASPVRSRSYAILLAGNATEYIHKVYGGLACLFEQMLNDPGETWHTYHVKDAKFPSDEDIHKYDGFVVTGSRHDAHSNDPWVLELCVLIRKLHKQKIKLLGICFGHQVISRALGGKTGRSGNGWDVGLRKILIADSMHSKPYALRVPSSLIIIEIHQDQVSELPPKGELLASSDKTSAEMFAVEDHVLCIQGHPEFTKDIVFNILDVCFEKHLMPEEVMRQARLSFEQMKADRPVFIQLCKSFLKGTPARRRPLPDLDFKQKD